MTWLLVDYGGVVSLDQSAETRRELAEVADADPAAFWPAYWEHRPPYDAAAVSSASYWRQVAADLGTSWSDERCAELVRIDVAGWLRPNIGVLGELADARGRGLRLALLSNAPHDLAVALRDTAWMSLFETMVFSCDLGAVKPDPPCYAAALDTLGAEPGEVLFVDDRPVNVDGAAAVGIRAGLFVEGESLAEALVRAREQKLVL